MRAEAAWAKYFIIVNLITANLLNKAKPRVLPKILVCRNDFGATRSALTRGDRDLPE